MQAFQAYRIVQNNGTSAGTLVSTRLDELDAGDVVIKTAYAGVNYKDALAGLGKAPIIRRFPCIGGIEATGVVVESTSAAFREGDEVIVHGRGLGVQHDGGFAEYVRVPADWIVRLPAGLEMWEAAALGVAGHTAAVSIDAMEHNGLAPEKGPVAVTGASGGAASLSIDMLSKRGYEVVAVSRKTDANSYLQDIGASRVIAPPAAGEAAKPLEAGQWAGAIDAAGGHLLAWLLRTMRPGGTVASFGNAAGVQLDTTVLPFILRGIRLLGINADTEMQYRQHIWQRLATDLKPQHLSEIVTEHTMDELPALMQQFVDGRIQGRHLIRFG